MMKYLLGKSLKQWRKQRKMSQEDLAFTIDVSVHTISAIERGINFPNPTTLEKLSTALNIPKEDFYRSFADDTEKQNIIKEIVGILNILENQELQVILKQIRGIIVK